MRLRLAAAALMALAAGHSAPFALAADGPCRAETFRDARYTICRFDLRTTDLRLFWGDAENRPFGSFARLASDLEGRGLKLAFAVNAGMYHPDFAPVGLHVEGGSERKAASTADGPGNFHLKPNGVFYIAGRRAGVMETSAFLKQSPKVDHATQSGPMLLSGGAIHPRFRAASDSRKIRNGVAVLGGQEVVFAVAEDRVNFHDFARLFRDRIGARDALFLDGTISSLFAPSLGRADAFYPLGPILGVVEPR